MNDMQLTAIIVGVTGILRTRLPKIDGIVVPIVAIGIGATIAALSNPDHWRDAVVHGVGVALAAVGGMTAIRYAGSKVGEAIGAATADATDDSAAPATPAPATSTAAANEPPKSTANA